DVVAAAEAQVLAVLDERHPREIALHGGRALVLRAVVDDHDLGVRIVVAGEALEAGHELVHPVPGEDEHDDAGQGGGRGLAHASPSFGDRVPDPPIVKSAPRSTSPSLVAPMTRKPVAWFTQS